MDEARWRQLVERWEERDKRWEERDKRWTAEMRAREERWEKETREHREFMREMWKRMEEMDIRAQATHEHLIGRMDALTEAVLRVVDRLDGGTGTATAT